MYICVTVYVCVCGRHSFISVHLVHIYVCVLSVGHFTFLTVTLVDDVISVSPCVCRHARVLFLVWHHVVSDSMVNQ